MSLYEWLLFLHVLSAFLVVGGLTALWALVAATRPAATLVPGEAASRFGRAAGTLVGAGLIGTIVFGIWLAIDVDDYRLWDGWILASLVLWLVAGWAGDRAGRTLQADAIGRRDLGIRYQLVTSVAVLALLVLMVWKPGA